MTAQNNEELLIAQALQFNPNIVVIGDDKKYADILGLPNPFDEFGFPNVTSTGLRMEYITAANEFSRLATDFPAGPWADDARFRVCESYYELSPHPQLDQEYTRGALDHCQSILFRGNRVVRAIWHVVVCQFV